MESETSRTSLFTELLQNSTDLPHYLALTSLLNIWPQQKNIKLVMLHLYTTLDECRCAVDHYLHYLCITVQVVLLGCWNVLLCGPAPNLRLISHVTSLLIYSRISNTYNMHTPSLKHLIYTCLLVYCQLTRATLCNLVIQPLVSKKLLSFPANSYISNVSGECISISCCD